MGFNLNTWDLLTDDHMTEIQESLIKNTEQVLRYTNHSKKRQKLQNRLTRIKNTDFIKLRNELSKGTPVKAALLNSLT